ARHRARPIRAESLSGSVGKLVPMKARYSSASEPVMNQDVHIVDIATLSPPCHGSGELTRRFYAQSGVARDVTVLATRAGRQIGVRTRASVLDFDALPRKQLVSDEHTPKAWCCALID